MNLIKTLRMQSNVQLPTAGLRPMQRSRPHHSRAHLRDQPGRRHAQCKMGAVVKTPSTEEPLRAPGSESSFTGLPAKKEDIPITSPTSSSMHMQEHLALVRTNFQFVFKDILDLEHFENDMFFSDPISKFTFFRGYQINVLFLKNFLAPIYEVHEVRQVGEQEILVKWSWTMNFWWNRFNPFRFVWDPRLAFSGLTVLGYNPDTGKWCKHVDGWDCLENQEFPSLEGFAFVAQQMFQLGKPPDRYTPEYMILKKYKEWEIRRYKPFLAAEADAKPGAGGVEAAERLLQDYLAGSNDREQTIDCTTPLFVDDACKVFCMLPGNQVGEQAPAPESEAVRVCEHPGGWYAAGIFGGEPSEAQIQREIRFVRACADQEGSRPRDNRWVFARYNNRSWPKGPFRRNDVLIPLDEATIDLWRGVDWDFVKRVVAQPV